MGSRDLYPDGFSVATIHHKIVMPAVTTASLVPSSAAVLLDAAVDVIVAYMPVSPPAMDHEPSSTGSNFPHPSIPHFFQQNPFMQPGLVAEPAIALKTPFGIFVIDRFPSVSKTRSIRC